MQRAGSAILGAALVVAAGVGAMKLSQKFPAKSKNTAIAMQAGAGALVGGGLAAAGYPTAGAISAVAFLTNAANIAMTTPAGTAQVGSLINGERPMAGLIQGDSYDQAMRANYGGARQVSGLVEALRR
jgi:hypothetical protein